MLLRVVLSLVFQLILIAQLCDGYRGSVVEYNYHYDSYYSLTDNLLRNAAVHANIIRFLRNKSDIVVFPEGSLSPLSGSKAAYIAAPPPSVHNFHHQKVLQVISDAAKYSKIYVVINIPEKYGVHTYSTNLAFDKNGEVIARYRNYHVGGEGVDRPNMEPVYFYTDFGVRFGLISSSDLMFPSPTRELIQKGVKDFVCPSSWISSLPFLTANQVQQSWTWSNNVTLLAAGLNSVSSGQSGSGIYKGRRGHLTRTPLTYFLANIPTTMIITTSMLHHPTKHSDTYWNDYITQNISLRKLSVLNRLQKMKVFAKSFKTSKSSDVEILSTSLRGLRVGDFPLKGFTTKLIEPNRKCFQRSSGDSGDKWRCKYDEQLCQGHVCCQFNLTVDYFLCGNPCQADTVVPGMTLDDAFYLFRYRMVVFDGVESVKKNGDTWGAQICGIVPCLDSNPNSCGKTSTPSAYKTNVFTFRGVTAKVWAQTVSTIHVSGNFSRTNSSVMPSLLLGRMAPSLHRFGLLTNDFWLQPNGNKSWSFILPDQERNLGAAGIINRLYSRDGLAPTSSAKTSFHHYLSLILVIIVFLNY